MRTCSANSCVCQSTCNDATWILPLPTMRCNRAVRPAGEGRAAAAGTSWLTHPLCSPSFFCSRAVRPAGGGRAAAADVPGILLARLPPQLQPETGEPAQSNRVQMRPSLRGLRLRYRANAPSRHGAQHQTGRKTTSTPPPLHPFRLQSWPNQNKKEEVERIKSTLLEQLQQLRGAPGAHALLGELGRLGRLRWAGAGAGHMMHPRVPLEQPLLCCALIGTGACRAAPSPLVPSARHAALLLVCRWALPVPDLPSAVQLLGAGFAMAERPPDALLPEFVAEDEDQVGAAFFGAVGFVEVWVCTSRPPPAALRSMKGSEPTTQ